MASVKSFYGKRTQHRFLPDAVNQTQDDDPKSADVVIIGPPTGGQDSSNLENEDGKVLNTTGLPKEIAEEVEVKWQKQHIQTQTFSSFGQYKNAQAVFLENPELVELTMWTSFEKAISPFIELLLPDTNQYDNRDKNKP